MTEAIKFQVADLLSQAEGKLSKAGLESIQSMLRSKTPDWLDELRNEIGVVSVGCVFRNVLSCLTRS